MSFVYELPYAVCNGRASGCCQIESGSTSLLWFSYGPKSNLLTNTKIDQSLKFCLLSHGKSVKINIFLLISKSIYPCSGFSFFFFFFLQEEYGFPMKSVFPKLTQSIHRPSRHGRSSSAKHKRNLVMIWNHVCLSPPVGLVSLNTAGFDIYAPIQKSITNR